MTTHSGEEPNKDRSRCLLVFVEGNRVVLVDTTEERAPSG